MRRPAERKLDTAPHASLLALGRRLDRLRRKCRRLRQQKGREWTAWSNAVDEANTLAQTIARIAPHDLHALVVHYNALAWLLLEADDVIVDAAAADAFIAFGRALRRLVRQTT